MRRATGDAALDEEHLVRVRVRARVRVRVGSRVRVRVRARTRWAGSGSTFSRWHTYHGYSR